MSELALLHRVLDAFDERRVDSVIDLIDPAFVDHHVPAGFGTGPDSVAAWWGYLWEALDIRLRIDDLVVGDGRIAGRYTATGALLQEFAGLPASGEAFTVPIMAIERFADGRLVERWEVVDTANLVSSGRAPGANAAAGAGSRRGRAPG